MIIHLKISGWWQITVKLSVQAIYVWTGDHPDPTKASHHGALRDYCITHHKKAFFVVVVRIEFFQFFAEMDDVWIPVSIILFPTSVIFHNPNNQRNIVEWCGRISQEPCNIEWCKIPPIKGILLWWYWKSSPEKSFCIHIHTFEVLMARLEKQLCVDSWGERDWCKKWPGIERQEISGAGAGQEVDERQNWGQQRETPTMNPR